MLVTLLIRNAMLMRGPHGGGGEEVMHVLVKREYRENIGDREKETHSF